jgi:hypothetical protein
MSNVKPLLGFPLCGLPARRAAGLPHKFETCLTTVKIQRAKWKPAVRLAGKIKEVVAAMRPFRNFYPPPVWRVNFLFLTRLLSGGLTFALLLAGCAGQQQYEVEQTQAVSEPIFVADLEKLTAMQTAEDVLAKMNFTIEKADAESGLIRTAPLPGAQFFEFWRSDNVGAFNCAEANLHSLRRIAEVNVRQQDEGLSISCEVNVYRLSLPEHPVSSSARAYEMFSESSLSLQKIKLNPEQEAGMAWVNLGRDGRLETEILKRIENRLTAENTENAENID